jgi:hypothetical protein
MNKRKRSRNFLIFIVLGVLIGLAVGWLLINPRPPREVAITRLRPDFRADAVLMVAENYDKDGDKMFALDQLARLDHGDLLTFVGKALQDAERFGYAMEDLSLLQKLLEGLDLTVYENWKILRGWNG